MYVIGSGPAGIACSFALVHRGLDVTLLDVGLDLEPEREKLIQKLSQQNPQDWDHEALGHLKEHMTVNLRGIPHKLLYGSDFPYRDPGPHIPLEAQRFAPSFSLAKAGLSNVWGAALLPYLPADIADWPIPLSDLAPHYQAVLSFMEFSACRDDLESLFPLYSNCPQELRHSRQAAKLLADMQSNRESLRASGFAFGSSRLAIRADIAPDRPGCVYCGLCMYGCPYRLIFNTSSTLAELMKFSNFRYLKNVVVQKLVESKGKVIVLASSRLSGERLLFDAESVYLGGGVLPTSQILLKSLEAPGHLLTIKHSDYFLLPLLRYHKTSDAINESLYTLAQVFIELFDPGLSEHAIHLQVYTYNDLYQKAFSKLLGPALDLFRYPLHEILDRLLVVQGFLHSEISSTISLRLDDEREKGIGRLILETQPNRRAHQTIRRVARKLWKHRRALKAAPLIPFLKIPLTGKSFHLGGTFPMKSKPSQFESDTLGRPYGFERVHIVDSSAFPSIPATTITFSVMANAHRIGSSS